MPETEIVRDLGDGLLLRQATARDVEALVAFNSQIFRNTQTNEPNRGIAAWTRDLAERPHPTMDVGDFILVQDTRSGEIVSSLCLISQTWSYGGIEFGVGRPEIVGTRPEYRRRGLVRAQFAEIHRRSYERGELVQAITGIPNFYRQFGYEMTIDLHGGHAAYSQDIPKLKDGETEPYRVRPASDVDVPFLSETYRAVARRSNLSVVRDAAFWRYEIAGRSAESVMHQQIAIVESVAREAVGFLVYQTTLDDNGRFSIEAYELAPGVSWLAVTPSVLRYLQTVATADAAHSGKPLHSLLFGNGVDHPVARAFPDVLSRVVNPYAWYVRVSDLTSFLWRIAPVLEDRLANSLAAGHSGQLQLSFFREGVRLVFAGGKLIVAESQPPRDDVRADAAFPGLTFLHLLFGYRSLEELRYAFPDCWASREARVILSGLFPKQSAFILPIA